MSSFDIDSYLNSKLADLPEPDMDYLNGLSPAKDARNKLEQVFAAAEAKKEALKYTTIGRLGLDPDSAEGVAVNSGMRALSTTSRMAGEVRTAPSNALDSLREDLVGRDILEAAARRDKGIATPEDIALLDGEATTEFSEHPKNLAEAVDMFKQLPLGVPKFVDTAIANLRGMTNQDRVNAIKESRKETAAIRDSFDNIDVFVSKENTDKFDADLLDGKTPEQLKAITDTYDAVAAGDAGSLKKVFTDAVPAMAKLIANVGATALDNPKGATEYVIENLPQLAVGVLGKGALTSTNAAYAIDYHNKGILAYQEANDGALPTGEDAMKIAAQAASLALAEQFGEVSVLKTLGLKKAGLEAGKTGIGRLVDATKSTLSEMATEGYQTATENMLEQKEVTAEDVYKGAAVGAIASAGVTAGPTAVGLLKDAANAIPKGTEEPVAEADYEADLEIAQKNEAFLKAKVANAEPAKQAELVKIIEAQKAALEATTEPAEKAVIEQRLKLLDSMIVPEAEIPAVQAQLKAAEEARAVAETAKAVWLKDRNDQGDIREDVSLLSQPVDPAVEGQAGKVKKAKQSVLAMALNFPGTLSAQNLTDLASSPNFTVDEQKYFLSLAKIARSKREAIETDVAIADAITGLPGSKNISLSDYQTSIDRAIKDNDTPSLERSISNLTNFAQGKEKKAAALKAAFTRYKQTGVAQMIVPQDGDWVPAPEGTTIAQLDAVNGLQVASNTAGVIRNVRQEAGALRNVVDATNQRIALLKRPEQTVDVTSVPASEPVSERAPVQDVAQLTDPELNDLLETIDRDDPRFDALNEEMNKRETEAYKEIFAQEEAEEKERLEEEAARLKQVKEERAKDKVEAKPKPQSESDATTEAEKARKDLLVRFKSAPTERVDKAIASRLAKAAEIEATDAVKAGFLRKDAEALQDMLVRRAKREASVQTAEAPKETTTKEQRIAALEKDIQLLGQLQNAVFSGKELTGKLEGLSIKEVAARVRVELKKNEAGLSEQELALQLMLANPSRPVTKKEMWDWVKTLDKPAPHLRALLQALFRSSLTDNFKGFTSYTTVRVVDGETYTHTGTSTLEGLIGLNMVGVNRNPNTLEVIVHEVVHEATRYEIEDDILLKGDINGLQQEIKDWLKNNPKALSASDTKRLQYALKNPHELLTMALTDLRVAQILDKINLPTGATAFEKFAQAILDFFRRSGQFRATEMSALARTLSLADAAFQGKVDIQTVTETVQPAVQEVRDIPESVQLTEAPVIDDAPFVGESAAAPVQAEVIDFEADIALAEQAILEAAQAPVTEEGAVPTPRRTNEVSPLIKSTLGTLKVFTTASAAKVSAKNYKGLNLLAQMFKQSPAREGATTPRALVAVADLVDSINNAEVDISDLVNRELNPAQTQFVDFFLAVHETWKPVLEGMLSLDVSKDGTQYTEYRHRNPLQFFMDEAGNVEENVKTAIIAVALQFIKDKASAPRYRSSADINRMIGRQKKAFVSPGLRRLLGEVIASQNNLNSELGKKVLDILGMSPKDGQTLINEQGRMEAAIGAVVPALLEQLGYLKQTPVNLIELNNAIDYQLEQTKRNNGISKNQSIIFYALEDAHDEIPLADIKEGFKKTGSFMADLFGVEAEITYPSNKAVRSIKKSLAKGRQKLNDLAEKVAKKVNKEPYQVRKDVHRLLTEGPNARQFFEKLAGIEAIKEDEHHIDVRDSLKAKNENLQDEVSKALEVVELAVNEFEGGIDALLYIPADPWKNNRLGYGSTMLNMQTSKIHRFLFKKASWNTTVSTNEGDASLDSFKLRVLEGLDVKTDSVPDAVSLAKWGGISTDPVFTAAADLLHTLNTPVDGKLPEITEANQEIILAAVKKGGMKLHSLEALTALGAYNAAVKAGSSSFDTTLTAEIDGKTNGVMLSNWQLGSLGRSFAERGGFYFLNSKAKHFSAWKPGQNDIYQHLMVATGRKIAESVSVSKGVIEPSLKALYRITGDLVTKEGQATSAGRNALKPPLIALNYGSGLVRASEAMAEEFVTKIQTLIGDIHRGEEYQGFTGLRAIQQLEDDLNTIVMARDVKGRKRIPDWFVRDYKRIFVFNNTQEALDTRFKQSQIRMLLAAHKALVGDNTVAAMEEELADYIEARKQLVTASNLTYEMYNAVYTALREAFIKSLIKVGEIEATTQNGTDVPLYTLSIDQEKALNKLLEPLAPRINSASSLGGEREQGFYLGGSQSVLSSERPFAGRFTFIDKNGKKTAVSTHGYDVVKKAPGVTVMSNGIQGLDGDIMMRTLLGFDAVGIHDAIMVAYGNAEAAGEALNQNTFDGLLNYSLPSEVFGMLENTLVGLSTILENWENKEQLKPALEKIRIALITSAAKEAGIYKAADMQPFFDNSTVENLATTLFQRVKQMNVTKLRGLSKLAFIDQYTIQGGAWEVPEDSQKAAAEAMVAVEKSKMSPTLKNALKVVDRAIKQVTVSISDETLVASIEEVVTGKQNTKAFGDLLETALEIQEASTEDAMTDDPVEEQESSEDLGSPPPNPVPPNTPTSSLEVYNALGNGANPVTYIADNARLRDLLANVIPKLYGPFETMYLDAQQRLYNDPADVFMNNVALGNTPFYTDVLNSPLVMGEQMGYVAELLQQVVHSGLTDSTTTAQRQLVKLFEEARTTIDPLSLDADPATSQRIYDFIFTIPKGDTSGTHLSRFASIGLVHPTIVSALGFTTTTVPSAKPTTLYGKLLRWFEQLVDFLAHTTGKAYGGQRADQKLRMIVDRIVELEADRIERNKETKWDELQEQISEIGETLSEKGKGLLTKASKSDFFMKSGSPILRTVGVVTTQAVEGRFEEIVNGLANFYHNSVKGRGGEIAELVNEIRGTTNDKKWGHLAVLLAKVHEKIRKEVSTNVGLAAVQGFRNNGTHLTQEVKENITRVLLKAEAFSLLEGDTFTLNDLLNVLNDPQALQQKIAVLEQSLTGTYRNYYLEQVQHTGNYMATGRDTSGVLVKNATSLAYLDGTVYLGRVSKADADAVIPALDKLMSLHALRLLPQDVKDSVVAEMRAEAARSDGGNGIELVLKLAQHTAEKALKENFGGNPRLMEKGYVPLISDPRVETKVVPAAERAALIAQGWKEHSRVGTDPAVSSGPQYLMVLRRGLRHRVTGTLGLNGLKAKGQANLITDPNEVARIETAKQIVINRMFKPKPGFDVKGLSVTHASPLFNDMGIITGYRYTATQETLKDLYKQNLAFDTVLGVGASSVYSKVYVPKQNEVIIDGLHTQWLAQSQSRKAEFIYVGPASKDPEIAQSYALLPEETRRYIEQRWGSKGMFVRRDMYNMHFGYRKFGLADMFDESPESRNHLKKLFVFLVRDVFMLGDKAALRVAQSQDIWEAFVAEAKDIIVVKTGAVLFWNIISNLTALYLAGVPVADIARSHRVAFKGAMSWNKDSAELRQLKAMQSAGYKGNVKDLEHQIARLETALKQNPVKDLIEAGLMPTIVEDVTLEDNEFTYKSDLVEATENISKHIPKILRDTAKVLYVAKDTTLYSVLSQGTQMSDFVARYTLYKHETSRKKNPLSHIDAVISASDMFVNYDIPSGKGLQFMNDMGFVMFTKYYLRIQRMIQQAALNNPLRALGILVTDNYLLSMQTIMDSSIFGNGGISGRWGAFEYPDAIFEGLPAKMLGKLF